MPESSVEWLEAQGFVVSADAQRIEKTDGNGEKIVIAATELRGHTVDSFKAKARARGWVTLHGGLEATTKPYGWPIIWGDVRWPE